MSAENNVNELVKQMIQVQIVQVLNSAPDAIEKLVKAALSRPVDTTGKFSEYGKTMPYLDYVVGEEIRRAAEGAVRTVISESAHLIEAEVRKGLSTESVVAAVVNSFVGAASENYRISVKFENSKPAY